MNHVKNRLSLISNKDADIKDRDNVNKMQSKRLLYSFNKLDDSSVITILKNDSNSSRKSSKGKDLESIKMNITNEGINKSRGLIIHHGRTGSFRTKSCRHASKTDPRIDNKNLNQSISNNFHDDIPTIDS